MEDLISGFSQKKECFETRESRAVGLVFQSTSSGVEFIIPAALIETALILHLAKLGRYWSSQCMFVQRIGLVLTG
jgi:hypothetical protein